MHATAKSRSKPTVARTVAPEDLAPGDYVALLSVEHEFPLLAWLCDPPSTQHDEVVRIRRTTDLCRAPLLVCEVCLPLVFTKRPNGEPTTLDVRSCKLIKLNRNYGRRVSKAMASTKAKQSKRGKRRKKK